MPAYYNEIDKYCVRWLRNLIKEGLIAPGEVDDRPIQEVLPKDILSFEQVHFFAGIGGWSYALRLAGVCDETPVWTGSCPCQPFSIAGSGKGVDDERHLWPFMRGLIEACKPPTVFGEQVASPAGRDWFSGVRVDLEALGYEVGAADLCAPSVGEKVWVEIVDEITDEVVYADWEIAGAPHIRQRLYWGATNCRLADSARERR